MVRTDRSLPERISFHSTCVPNSIRTTSSLHDRSQNSTSSPRNRTPRHRFQNKLQTAAPASLPISSPFVPPLNVVLRFSVPAPIRNSVSQSQLSKNRFFPCAKGVASKLYKPALAANPGCSMHPLPQPRFQFPTSHPRDTPDQPAKHISHPHQSSHRYTTRQRSSYPLCCLPSTTNKIPERRISSSPESCNIPAHPVQAPGYCLLPSCHCYPVSFHHPHAAPECPPSSNPAFPSESFSSAQIPCTMTFAATTTAPKSFAPLLTVFKYNHASPFVFGICHKIRFHRLK